MSVMLLGRIIFTKLLQLENVKPFITVIDSGIDIEVIALHPQKAILPNSVTLLGISIFSRFSQYAKAPFSMILNEAGSVMCLRDLHC